MIPHFLRIIQMIVTLSAIFTLVPASITSVVPDSAEQGEELTVSITGQGSSFCIIQGSETISNVNNVYFQQGSSIIHAGNFAILNASNLTADFTIASDSPLGLYDVFVEQITNGTHSLASGFKVTNPNTDPAITSTVPNSAKQGEWLQVTIAGRNTEFFDLDSLGDTIHNVNNVFLSQNSTWIANDNFFCIDDNSLCVTFTIPVSASIGPYDVVVARLVSSDTLTLTSGFYVESNGALGVIGHWTFDEGSGDSAYDLSGNGNHFRLLDGVTWVDSKNGKALKFDGIDDKGLCADKPDQTGMAALTIESVIWVEHHTATKWGPVIGKWGPGSTQDDAWALDVDRYSPYGGHGVVVGSTTKHINGTTPVPIQKWIHFVFTWNGSKMALYINGRRTDSLTVSSIGTIQDSDTEIRLGHNVDPHFFNGMIDQITLYDYALHPDTIVAHFEELVGPSHEINIGMKKHYAKPGDELWVPVYIANYEDTVSITSIQFSVNIDTSVISFLEVSSDSGIASNWQLFHNPMGDSIAFSMGGVGQTIEYGEGELIRCKFKVKTSIPSGSFSDLVPSDVLIDEGNNVYPTTTLGKILVDDISVIYGDVSGNNEVTAYDGAGIVKYIVGVLTLPDPNYPNFTMQVADVSGDGNITSYDAALVFMYSIGLIQKFPVETIKEREPQFVIVDGFPNAALKLVKSPLSTANTVYYDLLGSGIYGAISSDIKIKYDPAKIYIEQGGSITTEEYLNLESSVDKVNKTIQLSITTADDFDEKGTIKLATIEVPVPDTNSLEGAVYFISGLINEEVVEDLDPLNPTDISVSQKLITDNAIEINKLGLVIHNSKRLPVSIQIYDMRGRRLYVKLFEASDQMINININTLAQGLYIYKIKMGSQTITKPFLIRK